jgi:hypothetical protein
MTDGETSPHRHGTEYMPQSDAKIVENIPVSPEVKP